MDVDIYPWNLKDDGLSLPFRPGGKTVCRQNPPDFSWPYVEEADCYHIQVGSDYEMETIVFDVRDIKFNFYNFNQAFRVGKWFWRVRYHTGSGWSIWSYPRRFRITSDACIFAVPHIEDIIAQTEKSHPRIWTTPSTLEQFRSRANGQSREWFSEVKRYVEENLDSPLPKEPVFKFDVNETITAERMEAEYTLKNASFSALMRMYKTAFTYLITDDKRIGRNAVNQLLNLASWDVEGSTGYSNQDQIHRAIAYRCAMAYDWCFKLFETHEKKLVLDMIRARTKIMAEDILKNYPLRKFPYNSHGQTAFGYIGIIAIATLHDLPEAVDWFREVIPAFVNILPVWGGDDGGWAQGTNYWGVSSVMFKELADVLLYSSGLNVYNKAYCRLEKHFPLYFLPPDAPTGGFGDDSDLPADCFALSACRRMAQLYNDPVAQWAVNGMKTRDAKDLFIYFYGDNSIEAEPPLNYEPARLFEDIGWAALHSDLADKDRISFYFKSSTYGSYNHSHADQNSFIINAFGKALAIDSGYYDWYHSTHDYNYTKRTFAHNAVTYDGRKGQPVHDINAKGIITGFVTSPRFDAVSGDATQAYAGGLQRAKRHVIYLRPSMFVVIDDLATSRGNTASFEWWLHAQEQMDIYRDRSGATIVNGNASMKARIYYPAGINSGIEEKFIGVDGKEARPEGRYSSKPDQKHLQFATPPVNETIIVSTLNPYLTGTEPQNVITSTGGNYLELIFEDGTQTIVRLTASGRVNTGNVVFDGTAAVIKGNDVMLVSGTSLSYGNTMLISSELPVTAVVTGGKIGISCQDDSTVQIYAPRISRLTDSKNNNIPSASGVGYVPGLLGISWSVDKDCLSLRLEKGFYNFFKYIK